MVAFFCIDERELHIEKFSRCERLLLEKLFRNIKGCDLTENSDFEIRKTRSGYKRNFHKASTLDFFLFFPISVLKRHLRMSFIFKKATHQSDFFSVVRLPAQPISRRWWKDFKLRTAEMPAHDMLRKHTEAWESDGFRLTMLRRPMERTVSCALNKH